MTTKSRSQSPSKAPASKAPARKAPVRKATSKSKTRITAKADTAKATVAATAKPKPATAATANTKPALPQRAAPPALLGPNLTDITVGIDLGDKKHAICALDASGEILDQRKITNTNKACAACRKNIPPPA